MHQAIPLQESLFAKGSDTVFAVARDETKKTLLIDTIKSDEMKYGGCVYILTNKRHTVLYTGVTSDLKKRLWQHQNKEFAESFTAKYNCNHLVYYENLLRIEEAIAREKQIKGGSRNAKETLINKFNPEWKDLSEVVENW